MQQQYQQPMEDKLSVLDLGKEVAMASLNPFYRAQFDPNFWSPNSYNGVRIGSGLLDNKSWGNRAITGAYDRVHKLATGRTYSQVQNARRGAQAMGRAGAMSGSTLTNGRAFSGISAQGGASSSIRGIERSVNKFSGGALHYTDGYLGVNMGRLTDGSGAANSKFGKAMTARIASSNDVINDVNKMKASYSSHTGSVYRTTKSKGRSRRRSKTRVRSQFRDFVNKYDDFDIGAGKKGVNKALFGMKHVARTDKYLAMAGAGANYAGRFAGKVAIKGALIAGKASATLAVASLLYEGVKMVTNPIAQAGVNAIDNAFNSFQTMAKPDSGGRLNMDFLSQGAATERQRAVQAISKSRINGRSMMGNEAQYMHA